MTTMRKKLSPAFTKQVKKMLPKLRKETEEELAKWGNYIPGPEFYADEKVLETLPFAAYEFLSIGKHIRVDRRTLIEWFNDGIFRDILGGVICHALRRLALKKIEHKSKSPA